MNKQDEIKKAFSGSNLPFSAGAYSRNSIALQAARGEYPKPIVGTWHNPMFILWREEEESLQ
jgi:hypothetical protein